MNWLISFILTIFPAEKYFPAEGYIVYHKYEKIEVNTKHVSVNALMPDTLFWTITVYFKKEKVLIVSEDGNKNDNVDMKAENFWVIPSKNYFQEGSLSKSTGLFSLRKEDVKLRYEHSIETKKKINNVQFSTIDIPSITSSLLAIVCQHKGVAVLPSTSFYKMGLSGVLFYCKSKNSVTTIHSINHQTLSDQLFDVDNQSQILSTKIISEQYFR